MICGFDTTVDVVLNSMAFTFISEVAEMFAHPVLKHYSATAISGLDASYGNWDTYYIVTEYDDANASDTGWYVKEDAPRTGLVTDFKYRYVVALSIVLSLFFFSCYCRSLAVAALSLSTPFDLSGGYVPVSTHR
jgi:hypothetical protein